MGIDTKKLFAEMQKRDEEESMREKKRQEAIDQGIDPEEFLKNELAKANAEAEAAKASKSVASQSSVESSNDPEKSEIPKILTNPKKKISNKCVKILKNGENKNTTMKWLNYVPNTKLKWKMYKKKSKRKLSNLIKNEKKNRRKKRD